MREKKKERVKTSREQREGPEIIKWPGFDDQLKDRL